GRRLDLAPVRRVAATRCRVVGAAQLRHLAGRILLHLAAGNEIRVAQPHLGAGGETEELLRWALHEVVALDEDLAAELDAPRPRRRIVRMVDGLKLLTGALIVLDPHFQ